MPKKKKLKKQNANIKINETTPSIFHISTLAKKIWAIVSAFAIIISLFLAYTAISAKVSISPVIELSSKNKFAFPFRIKNTNILPIRDVRAEMVIKYVEDDHQNRFFNNHENVSIRRNLPSGDYVDYVFEGIYNDSYIIKGEIEVVIYYKFPLLNKDYIDKKNFYARQQPDGSVRWLAN